MDQQQGRKQQKLNVDDDNDKTPIWRLLKIVDIFSMWHNNLAAHVFVYIHVEYLMRQKINVVFLTPLQYVVMVYFHQTSIIKLQIVFIFSPQWENTDFVSEGSATYIHINVYNYIFVPL